MIVCSFTLAALLFNAVSGAPAPDAAASSASFSTSTNTIRNLACIRAGNTGPACHDGGAYPDPGAIEGKTACGTDPLQPGIVGIDFNRFGEQTGKFSPTNLCGHSIKITRVDSNGKLWTTTGIIMDRISQNNGPQIDLASDLNLALGGNGKDNIENCQFRIEISPTPVMDRSSVVYHTPGVVSSSTTPSIASTTTSSTTIGTFSASISSPPSTSTSTTTTSTTSTSSAVPQLQATTPIKKKCHKKTI